MLFILEKAVAYLSLFGIVLVFTSGVMLARTMQTRLWQSKALCLESIGCTLVWSAIACLAFCLKYGYHLNTQAILTILLIPSTLWFSIACIITLKILRFRGKMIKCSWLTLILGFVAVYMIGFLITR